MSQNGQIHFFENGVLIATKDAAEFPDSIRFADVDGQQVAVAKIVATTVGDTRSIAEFAADGRFLRSSMEVRPGAPAA
jgi:hypothetical protein